MPIIWNINLVVLSIIVAILGSFTALSYAGRMRASTGHLARIWMIAGGVTLAMAVWSMHFIGMLAFHLPIPIAYDVPLTLISILPVIAAALLGFYLLQSAAIQLRQILIGGFFMGIGIAAMHYVGMAALKMQPAISYDPLIFILSIIIAISAAIGALLIVYLGEKTGWQPWVQYFLGALIMGFAIAGMHYTGMAGANIAPGSICTVDRMRIEPTSLALIVTGGVLMLFGAGWISNLFERRVVLDQLRIADRKLELSDKELRIAASAFEVQESVMITDAENIILRTNQAFTKLTGYSPEEVIGKTPAILQSGMHDEKFYTAMWQALQREKYWSGEVWDKRKDGSIYPKRLTINAVTNSKGQVTNYVAAFTDITQVKEAQEDIYRLAFFDALTNLPNRRLLLDRLKRAIVVSNRNHLCGAVLFIDLDNFKSLNDTQGHDFGDLMLIEVTRRVQDCLRENDTVARLGGDEFVVMLEGLSKLTEQAATLTQLVAEKICNAINQPYFLKGHEYHSSASIGISMFCGNNVSIEELLKHADTAMYQAKQSGRNTLRFFDPSMQAALETRAALEADLRQALSQNQFKLYYQIQVNSNRRIFGAEVLLRWQHSERGLVGPMEFIPLAEETGLILPIGKYVLEAACKQLKAWEGKPHTRHLVLAVNISGVQFQQPGFIEEVRTVLNQTGAHPELLKLELTESLVIDIDEAIKKMQTLRSLGVEFSMDDFGTGYSSLASLKLLPLAQLKIDRSFVRDITTDANDAVIVKTIIGMANTLELEVIAEGVETEEQLKLLKQYRCRFFQGYLFSEPLPLEALEQLLKQPVKSQRKIVQA